MHWLRCLLLITIVGISGIAGAATADSDPAATLRAKYAALQEQLRKNQFKRPLVLDSAETPSHLKGDIYAIVDYPFGAVNAGLNNPDHWCDVMLLHINTKYCHAMVEPSGTNLRLHIGRKTPEELATAPRLDFHYSIVTDTPKYIEIMLSAKDGPLGTSDYLILLEAVALPSAKTFLHLTYSYAMNISARLAMQTYLGTIGSDKVGFTVIGKRANGQPDYVGGVRGLVERNTMRYYLAIDTFLEAASAAPPAQFERRLQNWFTATERYSQQLHEVSRQQYLEMKRAEYIRQQTAY
ncbi:MAG: hypothetical protein HHJ12_17445 [Glaciimonas sp.]|nr:hypothetical protein [Glaciimonas sp.]